MRVDLAGRTALVTGGTRGIGLAITRALLAAGARVVALSRAEDQVAAMRATYAHEPCLMTSSISRVRFLRPVYIGDTLTVDYEIVERQPDKERVLSKIDVTNQKGELVFVATHVMQLVD
jgi:NAD(P)-dependent dehydrogenase (short-subunit alcohol dehydrogenase family)